MVKVRFETAPRDARFNVLLTEDRPQPLEHWTSQLPRLLEPQGIAAFVARSGEEAMAMAGRLEIHAAVIDLATPLDDESGYGGAAAGLRLLELFQRLPRRPATVVIHRPAYTREADRLLREALRLGAFCVLHKPVELEQLLAVFRRLVDRHFRGAWPGSTGGLPGSPNY